MAFSPKEHLTKLQGKDYLEVKWRLVWFREDHPKGGVITEMISEQPPVVKATIKDAEGHVLATGHGSANADGKRVVWGGREIEKAETAAIGRALANAGYGTQFSEDDEGDHLADSPVEPRQPQRPAPTGKELQHRANNADLDMGVPPTPAKPATPQPAAGEKVTQPAQTPANVTPMQPATPPAVTRPYTPAQLYARLQEIASKNKNHAGGLPISPGARGILVKNMEERMNTATRHYLTDKAFGKASTNDLIERERIALWKWLNESEPQDVEAEIKLVIAARQAEEQDAENEAIAQQARDMEAMEADTDAVQAAEAAFNAI